MSDEIEPIVCSLCDNTIDEGDERRFNDGEIACADCTVWCESCDGLVTNDEAISDGSNFFCDSCGSYCERCNSAVLNDDTCSVDNESWCEYCAENYTFWCESCDTRYSSNGNYADVEGDTWCEDCTERNAWYCDDCDVWSRDGNDCDHCGTNHNSPRVIHSNCRCRRIIHDYSCKPTLVFHGESNRNLYMGFELETQIQAHHLMQEAAEFTSRSLASNNLGIIKHDGSIGRDGYDGFEIVTQPHTHLQYREHSDILWQTIDTLRTDYNARSWDTKSCGLHIHISRAGFSSGAHLHRFISLVYSNAPQMMKFAGRKSDYARFNDIYTFDEYDRPTRSLKHKVGNPQKFHSERYSAVNTQNRETIELRFFRGTMNTRTILSALDLAQAMVEYTRTLRLDDVKLGALDWAWFADYVRDNNGLYPDLYSRLDKIESVNINQPTLENA